MKCFVFLSCTILSHGNGFLVIVILALFIGANYGSDLGTLMVPVVGEFSVLLENEKRA